MYEILNLLRFHINDPHAVISNLKLNIRLNPVSPPEHIKEVRSFAQQFLEGTFINFDQQLLKPLSPSGIVTQVRRFRTVMQNRDNRLQVSSCNIYDMNKMNTI